MSKKYHRGKISRSSIKVLSKSYDISYCIKAEKLSFEAVHNFKVIISATLNELIIANKLYKKAETAVEWVTSCERREPCLMSPYWELTSAASFLISLGLCILWNYLCYPMCTILFKFNIGKSILYFYL